MLRLLRIKQVKRLIASSSNKRQLATNDSVISEYIPTDTYSLLKLFPEKRKTDNFERMAVLSRLGLPPLQRSPKDILDEKIAMIGICIHAGEMLKAEVTFFRILQSNYTDVKRFVDVRMFNAFIEGFIKKGMTSRALEWFDKIGEFNYTPSEETFNLLLFHFACKDDIEKVTHFVRLAQSHDIDPRQFLNNDNFLENSLANTMYTAVLGKLNYDIDGYQSVDDMLYSAIQEQTDIFDSPTSTTTTEIKSSSTSSDTSVDSKVATVLSKEIDQIHSTGSLGVSLLQKTLQRMVISNDTINSDFQEKMNQQLWLEDECSRLSLSQHTLESIKLPESLKKMSNLPKTLMQSWIKDMVLAITNQIQDFRQMEKQRNKKNIKKTEKLEINSDDAFLLPFFKLLKPEQLAFLTICEFLKVNLSRTQIESGSHVGEVKLTGLVVAIGKLIELEANALYLKSKKNSKDIKTSLGLYHLSSTGKLFNKELRKVARRMSKIQEESLEKKMWSPVWPDQTHAKVGAILASMLIKTAKIDFMGTDGIPRSEPAFSHVLDTVRGDHTTNFQVRIIGKLKFHPQLIKRITESENDLVVPRQLPMLVPPKPWLSPDNGGYLSDSFKNSIVRFNHNRLMRKYVQEADQHGHLSSIYYCLDVLGSTAWRINRGVLDVAIKCWNEGGVWPCIPSAEVVKDLPPLKEDHTPEEKKKWWVEKKRRDDKETARYSQRCDTNYKVLLAKAFENEQLYFPHYIDFRGRAYPLPVHLNHIGNDLCRGLLLFHEAKPLGERGLDWLKIQVANLFGKDKIAFKERIVFVDENIDKIYECADNPLGKERWWLEADSPWQFLGSCMELTQALRSPNPFEYKSCMPVHQDGTCNGLQHYAALGGDKKGAAQVNLSPSDKPVDVYTGVSNIVADIVDKDAAKGVPEALLMKGKINRKLVKQTVMTNTYGVTYIGARRQVTSRLEEAGNGLTDEQISLCSKYITTNIFKSLSVLFTGAREIQMWLATTAKLISSSVSESDLTDLELRDAKVLEAMGAIPSEYDISKTAKKDVKQKFIDPAIDDSTDDIMLSDDPVIADLLKCAVEDRKGDALSEGNSLIHASVEELYKENREGPVDKKLEQQKCLKMSPVIWTTPLGLPIVQPYRKTKQKTHKTVIQNVSMFDSSTPAEVDPLKQAAAFPPNFIHSLDAAHMMLSAISCKSENLQFASVHDSYWTHACDVDRMSNILRESFVKLHKRDIMHDLKLEFESRSLYQKVPIKVVLKGKQLQEWIEYCEQTNRPIRNNPVKKEVKVWVNVKIPELPKKGDFDIDEVMKSKYFFH